MYQRRPRVMPDLHKLIVPSAGTYTFSTFFAPSARFTNHLNSSISRFTPPSNVRATRVRSFRSCTLFSRQTSCSKCLVPPPTPKYYVLDATYATPLGKRSRSRISDKRLAVESTL